MQNTGWEEVSRAASSTTYIDTSLSRLLRRTFYTLTSDIDANNNWINVDYIGREGVLMGRERLRCWCDVIVYCCLSQLIRAARE